jgi:DNA modification methylase
MPRPRQRKSTSTSAFGTPGRIGHDASKFYGSRLYEGVATTPAGSLEKEQPLPADAANRIYLKSSETMTELPDRSVHLMITSPPYNVTKEYDDDLSLPEYAALLGRVFAESRRVLVEGGRACINIANLGRKPYLPLHSLVINEMQSLGFLMRGEIIWDKGASASPSTAWGSWQSASNPTLRDVHEYILVFSKGTFSRPAAGRKSTIGREEFLQWTRSVWSFSAQRARAVGHPAPFPPDLPARLIQLYSFEGDVVLDPFCGSGTTCLAARDAGRRFVGYEIKESYVHLAHERLAGETVKPARRKKKVVTG